MDNGERNGKKVPEKKERIFLWRKKQQRPTVI